MLHPSKRMGLRNAPCFRDNSIGSRQGIFLLVCTEHEYNGVTVWLRRGFSAIGPGQRAMRALALLRGNDQHVYRSGKGGFSRSEN